MTTKEIGDWVPATISQSGSMRIVHASPSFGIRRVRDASDLHWPGTSDPALFDDADTRERAIAEIRSKLEQAPFMFGPSHDGEPALPTAVVGVSSDTMRYIDGRDSGQTAREIVVRAFERMPGGHSSFLERLTSYHRRVAVRAGLPRWPQTTAEEQFVRALAVDRDERQPTARSAERESEATPGVTRPPWYFGFVGTTYVDLLVRCEHGQRATLRFRGPEQTVDVPIEIPRTVWPPLPGQPQYLASFAWARVRRTLAVKITDDNELRGSDVLLVDYDAWDGITDPDVFNDIELDVDGASEVDIVGATVVLNDTVLMGYSFPEPLRATQLKSASLKSALWFGTMRSLVHPWPKNPVADEIRIPREVFQPILEDPAVQSNPLLVKAASTLGQAWHERYGTSWPHDEEFNEWDPAPVDWCSEWASWVIRSVTALDTPTGSFGSDSMIEFFRERDRFAGPTDHRGHFLHLGAFVMGGFYVAVRSGGHSTMFVSWWSRNSLEGHRVPFQTASKVMSFLSIGGNQTRGRVSLDIPTVSDTPAFDASIDWWRRNLNGIDQEGFVDTIRKGLIYLTPAREG